MRPRLRSAALDRLAGRASLLASLRASLLAALLGVAGCGDGESPVEAFCEQWVTAYCEGNRDCCSVTEDTYADVDSCKAAQRARCALGTGTAFSGSPPLASFDSGEGSRALTDLREAAIAGTCSAPPALDDYALVIGTLVLGASCSPVGGDLSPIVACAPNSRCLLSASRTGTLTGQCVRESNDGAPCVVETCVPGFYCAGAGDPTSGDVGLCAERKADAEPCGSASECRTGVCVSELCGSFAGPGVSPWCVVGAGLGNIVPPLDDAGSDVDAGL